MQVQLIKIGGRFLVNQGPTTYKRLDTAFVAESVWSMHLQEQQVVYAINDDWPEKIHRFHPEQEVVEC